MNGPSKIAVLSLWVSLGNIRTYAQGPDDILKDLRILRNDLDDLVLCLLHIIKYSQFWILPVS